MLQTLSNKLKPQQQKKPTVNFHPAGVEKYLMAVKKQMRKRDQLYRYLHSPRPRPHRCTCYALTIHITRSRPPRVWVCVSVVLCQQLTNKRLLFQKEVEPKFPENFSSVSGRA